MGGMCGRDVWAEAEAAASGCEGHSQWAMGGNRCVGGRYGWLAAWWGYAYGGGQYGWLAGRVVGGGLAGWLAAAYCIRGC